MVDPNRVDVVVVGGGLAGLSAALKLKDSQSGLTYVVLESDTRFGGRTLTRTYDRDFGAGYVGGSQNYIHYLLRRFSIPTTPEFLDPSKRWLYQDGNGVVEDFPGDNPLILPGGANAVYRLGDLDTLALAVRHNLADPWNSPLAPVYDQMTVADWMRLERDKWDAHGGAEEEVGMSLETADAFVASIRCAFSLEPRDLSFFFFLYYCASAGSYAALVDVTGGQAAAEGTRLLFGTQSLVEALRKEVGPENVISDARVAVIDYSADGVLVETTAGNWTAKRVIVAMSPPASKPGRITYKPSFSGYPPNDDRTRRLNLCNAMEGSLGLSIKGFVRFKRPFWRDQGHIGYLLSVAPRETDPVSWTLDNVWDTSNVSGAGPVSSNARCYLMVFIVGDAANYWHRVSKDERARAVIEQLKRVYGFDDDLLYTPDNPGANYSEEDWVERIPGGMPAPAAMMPPGALLQFGPALRQPIGPIHWAGSESALEWCGYMDGAVESGFRAAGEVLAAFQQLSATSNPATAKLAAPGNGASHAASGDNGA